MWCSCSDGSGSSGSSGSSDGDDNEYNYNYNYNYYYNYTHYYYYGQPIDKNRADVEAADQEKKNRLARLEERKRTEKEAKKNKKSKRSRRAEFSSASRPTTAADGDGGEGGGIGDEDAIKDTDVSHISAEGGKNTESDTKDAENVSLVDGSGDITSPTAKSLSREIQNPNITKFIYRPRMIDILKKRDDPAEMPYNAPGREARKHVVTTRPFCLDEEVRMNDGRVQSGVYLSGFVEIDRSAKQPPFARFNSYRHIVRVEQNMVNQLIERVKVREDESK